MGWWRGLGMGFLGIAWLTQPVALAQNTPHKRSSAKPSQPAGNQAEAELAKRIAAAQAARTSGDPLVVADANQRLIALALRELAQLRLLEAAYPQAVELYQH